MGNFITHNPFGSCKRYGKFVQTERLAILQPTVFLYGGQNTSKPFKGFQEGKRVRLKLSHAKKIEENVEGIEFVVPRNRNQAFVVRNFLSGSYSVNGDYPLLDKVQKKKLLNGRFINQNDIDDNKKVAVISEDIYKQLFEKDEQAIGRYIQMNSINFTVIGVTQNSNANMGPSSDIHIPFTTFQQIYNQGDTIGWLMITGKPEYNIKQIEEDAKLLLRNLNKIHPQDKRAFGSFNLGKEFAKITGFLKGMQFLTWFVGIATPHRRRICHWKYIINNRKRTHQRNWSKTCP